MMHRRIRAIIALVAVLFGVATIVAGSRVLAGSDPGYIVYRPLLIYNTAVWLVLFLGMAWAGREKRSPDAA